MTPRLFAAAFGIAVLCIGVPSTVVAQNAPAAAQEFTLTSQIALRYARPRGHSPPLPMPNSSAMPRTVIAGHARRKWLAHLRRSIRRTFQPRAVAAAIGRIKAQLNATAAMAGHLHPEFHPPMKIRSHAATTTSARFWRPGRPATAPPRTTACADHSTAAGASRTPQRRFPH